MKRWCLRSRETGGRARVHNTDAIMAEIVAKRLVEHLVRAGFVVMKRPAERRWGSAIRSEQTTFYLRNPVMPA